MVDDGHAQEGAETFLAGLREVAVTRMGLGVLEIDRLLAGTHQADKPLRGRNPDLPDRILVEPFSRLQDIAAGLLVIEVNGADFRLHGCLNPGGNGIQGLLQVVDTVQFLNDTAQRAQHLGHSLSAFMAGRRVPL